MVNRKMIVNWILPIICLMALATVSYAQKNSKRMQKIAQVANGFTDAASFGFSPNATGVENVIALQKAVAKQGRSS